MSQQKMFDFKFGQQRDHRLSYFSFPPAIEKSSEVAIAAHDFNPCDGGHDESPSLSVLIGLWCAIAIIALGLISLLALFVLYDKNHPYTEPLEFFLDTGMVSNLFPKVSSFFIRAASISQVEDAVAGLPPSTCAGLIYSLRKCEPDEMILLAEHAIKYKIPLIAMVADAIGHKHMYACLPFLQRAVERHSLEIKAGVGLVDPLFQ